MCTTTTTTTTTTPSPPRLSVRITPLFTIPSTSEPATLLVLTLRPALSGAKGMPWGFLILRMPTAELSDCCFYLLIIIDRDTTACMLTIASSDSFFFLFLLFYLYIVPDLNAHILPLSIHLCSSRLWLQTSNFFTL
ncbi:hypothetical protein BP00DRAFT_39847 [Aspergillus indologenus CBS 114.80]|uniref:Uncharacterized protein n=1 Tax=Aspergillus indologenus CBS 114.80 TaxID=1450541 RepID=A0A2V5IHB7_9EURO|nr:hypothetical protein BP00DRAFT_39847 [Aspergillus indologenus CBS 114.80]